MENKSTATRRVNMMREHDDDKLIMIEVQLPEMQNIATSRWVFVLFCSFLFKLENAERKNTFYGLFGAKNSLRLLKCSWVVEVLCKKVFSEHFCSLFIKF